MLQHRECPSVSTFAAQKTKDGDKYVVNFEWRLKMDGSCHCLLMCLSKSMDVSREDQRLKWIPQSQLADHTPGLRESTTVDKPIGSDELWEVVLPSGTFMLASKFGYSKVFGWWPFYSRQYQCHTLLPSTCLFLNCVICQTHQLLANLPWTGCGLLNNWIKDPLTADSDDEALH